MARGVPFVKGHGTENDFVLLPDPDGTLYPDLDAGAVQRLTDRYTGLGADGVIRVVRKPATWPPAGRSQPMPSGSWTTATPTDRWPRCAATAYGVPVPLGHRPGHGAGAADRNAGRRAPGPQADGRLDHGGDGKGRTDAAAGRDSG